MTSVTWTADVLFFFFMLTSRCSIREDEKPLNSYSELLLPIVWCYIRSIPVLTFISWHTTNTSLTGQTQWPWFQVEFSLHCFKFVSAYVMEICEVMCDSVHCFSFFLFRPCDSEFIRMGSWITHQKGEIEGQRVSPLRKAVRAMSVLVK